MSEVQARLVMQRGPNPGTEFVLTQAEIQIGRASTNDVVIPDPEVSRQHAQLIRQEEGFAIQDLGSTNGSFVNYHRVTGLTPLNHGDVISFGEAIALTYWDESATDSQPVPPPSFREPPPVTAVPPTPEPTAQPAQPMPQFEPFAPPTVARNRRRWLIGCGCAFLLLICLCAAALFFLDAYDQGRLLYCGELRPFWETVLGPFGFSPACS